MKTGEPQDVGQDTLMGYVSWMDGSNVMDVKGAYHERRVAEQPWTCPSLCPSVVHAVLPGEGACCLLLVLSTHVPWHAGRQAPLDTLPLPEEYSFYW